MLTVFECFSSFFTKIIKQPKLHTVICHCESECRCLWFPMQMFPYVGKSRYFTYLRGLVAHEWPSLDNKQVLNCITKIMISSITASSLSNDACYTNIQLHTQPNLLETRSPCGHFIAFIIQKTYLKKKSNGTDVKTFYLELK